MVSAGLPVQPHPEILLAQDQRHPVMHLGAHLVRLDRDDAEAIHFALVVVPPFPEAAKGEQAAFVQADVNGLLAAGHLLPLVKAVRQDETAALLVGFAERGLGRQRLAARIDEAVADSLIPCPVGSEALAGAAEFGAVAAMGAMLASCVGAML